MRERLEKAERGKQKQRSTNIPTTHKASLGIDDDEVMDASNDVRNLSVPGAFYRIVWSIIHEIMYWKYWEENIIISRTPNRGKWAVRPF